MNLVSRSLLLVAAGLLASPARAELAGLRPGLRALLAAEEDRAALRALRAEDSSVPPSEQTGEAERIVPSGPTPADLAAALDVLAADLDDPEKTAEDAALDTLGALGAEVDGSFFDLDDYDDCVDACVGGDFTCSCGCLAEETGAREFGVRGTICGIVGPLVDASVASALATEVIDGVAEVLALIDPFIPAPPPPPTPPPTFAGYPWLNYAKEAHDGSRGLKDAELSSPRSVEELVEEIGEDVDLDGIHYKKDGLLSRSDCEALILHFDNRSARGVSPDQPFQVEEILLSRTEIAGVVGEEAFRGVLAFLFDSLGEAPVTAIVVRRTYADGVRKVGAMSWHVHEKIPGFKEGTVAVALNADDDVEGGALYVLARDGPVRAPRSQGRGYAFPHNTAHSVEPYKGVRYSLFVHTNLDQASEVRDV